MRWIFTLIPNATKITSDNKKDYGISMTLLVLYNIVACAHALRNAYIYIWIMHSLHCWLLWPVLGPNIAGLLVALFVAFGTHLAAVKGRLRGSLCDLAFHRQGALHQLALSATLSRMNSPFPKPKIVLFAIVFPNPPGAQGFGESQMALGHPVAIYVSPPFQGRLQSSIHTRWVVLDVHLLVLCQVVLCLKVFPNDGCTKTQILSRGSVLRWSLLVL